MRFLMTNRATSPKRIRARELGSGVVIGTSVMVSVVVSPKEVDVNGPPGPVKLGLVSAMKPTGLISPNSPTKHGPPTVTSPSEQSVELPLRMSSVTGPSEEVS